MSVFRGFPSRNEYVAIPKLFFSDVLPHIEDSAELLVTLHLFRLLGAKRGYPRAVPQAALADDRLLAAGFTSLGRDYRAETERGLGAALERGTFLQASASQGQSWLLLNTDRDRRAAAAITRGELALGPAPEGPRAAAPVAVPGPDIFTLYEESIGLITPLMAERLQEAEQEFPAAWVQQAFQIAVEANQRHWRYIEAILQRWKAEGKDDGKSRGYSKARRVAEYPSWFAKTTKQ